MTGTEEEREKWAANWPLHLEVLFPKLETRTPLPDPNFGTNSDIKELLSDGAPTDRKNIAASKLYGSGRSPLWPQPYEILPRYLERLERVLVRLLQQVDVFPSGPIDQTISPKLIGDYIKKLLSSDEKYWSPLNVLAGLGAAQVMELRQSISENSIGTDDAIRAGMQISEINHRLISTYREMPAHRQKKLLGVQKETKEDQFIRRWLNKKRLSPLDVQCKRRSRGDSHGLFRDDLRDEFRREFPYAPKGKFSQCLKRVTERWNVA